MSSPPGLSTSTRFLQLFFALSACLVLTAFVTSEATAQTASGGPNWMAQPLYGTINLSAGFTPDPYTRSVRAGGSSSNPVQGSGCRGYINTSAPDVDLNYDSGSFPLIIGAESHVDVTLVVYTPNGEWYCNDDGGDSTNSRITFNNPQSGNYNIWVGTYSSSDTNADATVTFSELTSSSSSSSSSRELNWRANPISGTVNLRAGFLPDPHVTSLSAGGSMRNPLSGSGCVGMVASSAPDVNLNYQAGSSNLYIYTRSNVDVTLVVYTPSGRWLCDDDSGDSLNSMISFTNPESGEYNIWVGVYSESDNYSASDLLISEIRP